jgi:hypothetical protein
VIQNLFQRRTAHCTLAYPIGPVLLAAVSIAFFGTNVRADSNFFTPGDLVVSRSVYDDNPGNVQLGQLLPPNCTTRPVDAGTRSRMAPIHSSGTTIPSTEVSVSPRRFSWIRLPRAAYS